MNASLCRIVTVIEELSKGLVDSDWAWTVKVNRGGVEELYADGISRTFNEAALNVNYFIIKAKRNPK